MMVLGFRYSFDQRRVCELHGTTHARIQVCRPHKFSNAGEPKIREASCPIVINQNIVLWKSNQKYIPSIILAGATYAMKIAVGNVMAMDYGTW